MVAFCPWVVPFGNWREPPKFTTIELFLDALLANAVQRKKNGGIFGGVGVTGTHTHASPGPPGAPPTTTRDSDPAQISSLSTLHSPRKHRSLVIRTHDTHLWGKR